jgi:hypothetical protein
MVILSDCSNCSCAERQSSRHNQETMHLRHHEFPKYHRSSLEIWLCADHKLEDIRCSADSCMELTQILVRMDSLALIHNIRILGEVWKSDVFVAILMIQFLRHHLGYSSGPNHYSFWTQGTLLGETSKGMLHCLDESSTAHETKCEQQLLHQTFCKWWTHICNNFNLQVYYGTGKFTF